MPDPGDQVTIRATEWRVHRSVPFEDCAALEVLHAHSAVARTFLLPFDRPRRPPSHSARLVSRRRWVREVAAAVKLTCPYGGLRFFPAGIRLLPYQLEPALAMLRHGALRMLLADEVGLGKTVEAGIIVRELIRRNTLARVLVLCPAGLRSQWARELSALFHVRAIEADAAWLHGAAHSLPADVSPWSMPGTFLASVDFVKRPEALRPLEDTRWDLLVVDEAHTATPGSDRYAAVDALACRAVRVLLLTATPHTGDEAQFRALCGLGGGTDAMVFYGRTRETLGTGAFPVRTVVLPVRLSAPEMRAHRLLEAYTARIYAERAGREGTAELIATILRKRALSSPVSLARSIRRRVELLASAQPVPTQLVLPLAPDEDAEDREPIAGLSLPALDDQAAELTALAAIAGAAADAARHDSKLRALQRLLRRARQPAIVFTEYRDTAEHLAVAVASAGQRPLVLHGGLGPEERRRVVDAFCEGRRLLVATDVASEGLNLQHACRLVVHYELPWTPSRLRQRLGRVHRIGQDRRVHEIALVADDTAERLVIAPLVRRAATSGAVSRGNLFAQLTESEVAAGVLGGAPAPAARARALPSFLRVIDLQGEAAEEARRLSLLRGLDTPGSLLPRRPAAVPLLHLPKRSRHHPGAMLALFRIVLRDRASVLEEDLVALVIRLPHSAEAWPRGADALRQRITAALAERHAALSLVLTGIVSRRLAGIAPLHGAAAEAIRKRARFAERRLHSAAKELVQAGLFDRRTLRERQARARIRTMLLEEERAQLAAGTSGAPASAIAFEGALRAVVAWSER